MEAKVHEATNNEAWGASSTLMQEIAQATFHYEYFNEIMPTIYKRFTEKEARQWRQIYKALVLLEYLVKNGSERVVDDARSHISMIKMMKNFHYVDEKGKDQGINVRNRAKELAELLNDVEAIKVERKKAKKNRNKYTGVGSDGGMSYAGAGIGGSRYEGFGSDTGGYSTGGMNSYGSGGYGNDSYDDARPGRYDEGTTNSSPTLSEEETTRSSAKKEAEPKKAKTAKELKLFDFDEPAVEQKTQIKSNDDDWGDFAGGEENEDDFDDFQSAPAPTTSSIQKTSTTNTSNKSNDIFDLLGEENIMTSSQPSPSVQSLSFSTLSISSNPTQSSAVNQTQSTSNISVNQTQSTASNNANHNAALGGMWSQASNLVSLDLLGSSQSSQQQKPTNSRGPSMNSLKSSNVNTDWNNWASANTVTPQKKPTQPSANFDDLLF
ncbi:hypothetical protein EDC96DRAFT_434895 [Choanephora cucurbitarum]|nr:hypothetical protein EDC96DRAFT_434895 [Choanephora cucurbitarum]